MAAVVQGAAQGTAGTVVGGALFILVCGGIFVGIFLTRRKRESWSFSPGRAEFTRDFGFDRPKVTNYLVDRVEIGHDVWTSGNGVTDHLRIKGPGHSSKTVVAFQYSHIYVYPSLAGPAIKYGLPKGVGEAYDSEVIATIPPPIVALSRLITDATRCRISIVVGSCREPNHSGD
jgi:hypothetical protein